MTSRKNNEQSLSARDKLMKSRIKKLRLEYGYSQEYVAEQIGVSQSAVSRFESNPSLISAGDVYKLSQLYQVSADYILGRTDIMDYNLSFRKNKQVMEAILNLEILKKEMFSADDPGEEKRK